MAVKRNGRKAAEKKEGSAASLRRILEAFADLWLEEGRPPGNVSKFCRELGISSAAFYRQFASMRAVEKVFWKEWIADVIAGLSAGQEWEGFSARERYLVFLFALAQSSLEKRELLAERFGNLSPAANAPGLEGFRSVFLEFAEDLVDRGRATGEMADRGALMKFYPGVLYLHLRLMIAHHLADESEDFQRTDALIEKTVALAFDLFRSQALDSALDLAKFLLPENPWPDFCGSKK